MNNGRCLVCPNKCSSNMHYHDRRLINTVTRTLKFAMKRYIDRGKDRTIQETKHSIENLLEEQYNEIHDTCTHIQNNCHGFNITEELYRFIKLLKNDIISLRSDSVIDNARKLIERLEILANNNSTGTCKSSRSKRKKRNQLPMISDNPTYQKLDLLNNEKYAEYTIEELIDLTHQSIEKHTLISQELNRRCQGTSIGYLSVTELLTLCEYYTLSRHLTLDELNHLHEQLQLEIQQSTDSDPLEILSVPTEKLLHLTAIKLCLQNLDKYE